MASTSTTASRRLLGVPVSGSTPFVLGEMNFINMAMWISNRTERSDHFHMRALHPHSLDVMRYFAGDVRKVHAFFKKGKGQHDLVQRLRSISCSSRASSATCSAATTAAGRTDRGVWRPAS